ncbi:hypothetical protein N7474_011135 [Penicillium riverlandense]|uniref:uncharacterized protein n=1 Tax=Penicillium riverlandense TaxID=1903569 RepID=UPI002546B4AC|nr:uncharacterized protein N7474_011135 [Penicillium riverlandense]KAJ5805248.1 hypothetical protein N7474_011135 [Penicillium riverlandense]
MALVAYSDSEGSDAEPETTPAAPSVTTKQTESATGFQVDRSNPRKIRVALPELKPDPSQDQQDDGPARKKARLGGGGGGALSGFNALLPAPKRAAEKKAPAPPNRKVFSLKTGATPGFDRDADVEMGIGQPFDDGKANGQSIMPGDSAAKSTDAPEEKKLDSGQVKLQGNPMMFRPLSVGRPNQKKKKAPKSTTPQPTPAAPTTAESSVPSTSQTENTSGPDLAPAPAPAPPKPKVSLFSLSSEDRSDAAPAPATAYEPLVYSTENEAPSAGPAPASEFIPSTTPDDHAGAASFDPASLNTIANDLNLSKSERRQLLGRNAIPAESRVLTFNTDQEYASNQAMAQSELAAQQHNPVRAIAPGKHTLQQLVNAANSQREALEESFATGRRNKKEAGSRYGW